MQIPCCSECHYEATKFLPSGALKNVSVTVRLLRIYLGQATVSTHTSFPLFLISQRFDALRQYLTIIIIPVRLSLWCISRTPAHRHNATFFSLKLFSSLPHRILSKILERAFGPITARLHQY